MYNGFGQKCVVCERIYDEEQSSLKALFKIYRLWYADLLFEAKFYFVSEHLPDDSDKLVGTVPKGIVMGSAFSSLGIGD